MPSRHKSTDEILEELVNNPEPERPLRGHELIRMVYAGRIPPGEYRYETENMDGIVKIETFRVDENGRIRDLKIWIENPAEAKAKSEKGKGRARRPQKTRSPRKRVSRGD